MTIIKCKMCGGDLEINEKMTVGTCKYCGSTMTLPKETDELKANLFNRANYYRRNNEYDKAYEVYESILNQDNTEAEAYWGLVLCKYGIEYVEDSDTHKLVPTCHRTLFGSILTDADYKAAIENSDHSAKVVYEAEAKAIDEIQKQILEISSKEEPFDVFICYKESDETGTRTQDSVLAQDLYYQLKREGYKVFFSRITLEKKLGSAYEPYIFAALKSAKVMVVLATKSEYINSPWVKNEWNRYLILIKNGEKKTIIPAYKDMNPYELPDEFSYLQAQDMSKLGFMQDLIRGIKKLIAEPQQKEVRKEAGSTNQGYTMIAPLLKRAFFCLEDREFSKADDLLEKVLNQNPENATAYVGKLMGELRVEKESKLGKLEQPLTDNINYIRALQFADNEYQKTLQGYNQEILDRLETQRKELIYQDALKEKQSGTITAYEKASELLLSIKGYKDSDIQAEECEMLAIEQLYKKAKKAKAYSTNENDYQSAAKIFERIVEYKDSLALAEECKLLANECVYQEGLREKTSSTYESDFRSAAKIFKRIAVYKDSMALAEECKLLANECVYQEGLRKKTSSTYENDFRSAAKIFKRIAVYKDSMALAEECENLAETARIKMENKKKRDRKLKNIILISMITISVFAIIFMTIFLPIINYHQAEDLFNNCQYLEAVSAFTKLGDFRNSETRVKESSYFVGNELLDQGKIGEATVMFMKAGEFKDAALKVRKNILFFQGIFTAGSNHTVGLKADGTVVSVGRDIGGQLNVSEWEDIVAIAAGSYHTVGLKADGTVVAVGRDIDGQLNVSEWEDIIAISAGKYHTVGLKSDGTVVAVGTNNFGRLNISEWEDIVAIAAGSSNTVGLKANGMVEAVGRDIDGQLNVSDWEDIVAVAAGNYHTVGLRADGTVVAVGSNIDDKLNISEWEDIVAITAGDYHTVGLKADGTVVAVGSNISGQLNTSDWEDIVVIAAGSYHTVGLKADGTVVAVGNNNHGQLNTSEWSLFQ